MELLHKAQQILRPDTCDIGNCRQIAESLGPQRDGIDHLGVGAVEVSERITQRLSEVRVVFLRRGPADKQGLIPLQLE